MLAIEEARSRMPNVSWETSANAMKASLTPMHIFTTAAAEVEGPEAETVQVLKELGAARKHKAQLRAELAAAKAKAAEVVAFAKECMYSGES